MFIHEIRLQNLLSFGPDTPPLELRPLNVLIGPNGSGKSNLIEAISLLRQAPNDLLHPIQSDEGDGIEEWIWKGNPQAPLSIQCEVDLKVNGFGDRRLQHSLEIEKSAHRAYLKSENISELDRTDGVASAIFTGRYEGGVFFHQAQEDRLNWTEHEINRSVLALRRDPQRFSAITALGDAYRSIRCYRDWNFSRLASIRLPQVASGNDHPLDEDFSNLVLVLHRLRNDAAFKEQLLERLNGVLSDVTDIGVNIVGPRLQLFLQERRCNIPASRLSDGTLHFLCLAAILLDPTPPPLICIEEPELGLHPDAILPVAEMLKEASERTQLVVTTHSDMIVDCLSRTPEDVIVCERSDEPQTPVTTTMTRLESANLNVWLEKYGLGSLWRSGQLGGNRW